MRLNVHVNYHLIYILIDMYYEVKIFDLNASYFLCTQPNFIYLDYLI